jgi:hypothetical protein
MTERTDPTVVACSLSDAEVGLQLERWRDFARCTAPAVTRTEHGLRVTFRALPGVEAALRRLVATERRCCGFADWSIRHAGGHVALEVSAQSDEAIAAVHGMFAGLGRERDAPSK